MLFTQEHDEMRRSLSRFIDQEINPYVDAWEEEGMFPAHDLFKKLGDAGFLGVCKPPEFGGLGLDYTYSLVMAEELGHVRCGAVPMAIGVHTDMCTPALARFGSDELRQEFLAPAIAGDVVGCIGVTEASAGSAPRRSPTAATTSSTAPRCSSPTASRRIGSACWPIRPTGTPTATSP